ncbi:MAG: hypothetical protein NWE92_06005 [Candidatus Bathyarchaeota archaeon]|nr:hypothetical protein [Candidatus Bathyarchaeota archaeon]
MSKVEFSTFTCPVCGFAVKTPFGKEDLDELVTLHNAKHHDATLRARISKTELIRLQKK